MNPEQFKSDLAKVGMHDGVPNGRLVPYWQAEQLHVSQMGDKNAGTLLLIRAFQCLFLETVELVNVLNQQQTGLPKLTFYTRFFPRLVNVFQQVCAVDLLASHGYPLVAYGQLRNIYDHLILISAAMQGHTDFFKIEGSIDGGPTDLRNSRKIRIQNDRKVLEIMTGAKSGLSDESIEALKLWDQMFDLEIHGAKASLATSLEWMQGSGVLQVYPKYDEWAVASFTNRAAEITWMAHRLMPLLQHSQMRFGVKWLEKWKILEDRFEDQVKHFAVQQQEKFGYAIVELVQTKFPFSSDSSYPLEGLDWPMGG